MAWYSKNIEISQTFDLFLEPARHAIYTSQNELFLKEPLKKGWLDACFLRMAYIQ